LLGPFEHDVDRATCRMRPWCRRGQHLYALDRDKRDAAIIWLTSHASERCARESVAVDRHCRFLTPLVSETHLVGVADQAVEEVSIACEGRISKVVPEKLADRLCRIELELLSFKYNVRSNVIACSLHFGVELESADEHLWHLR